MKSVHELLTAYLKKFKLSPELTEEEIAHWLLPREGVVDCFVVKDGDGKVKELKLNVLNIILVFVLKYLECLSSTQ